MKSVTYILFTIIAIYSFINCVSSSKGKQTKINISCRECSGMEVSLTRFSELPLDPKNVYKNQFDSLGNTRIEFAQDDTLSASLVIGEWKFYTTLYLEPGSDIDLTIDNGSFKFNGDLKIVNSYYKKINLVATDLQEYVNPNLMKVISASSLEQRAYLDSVSKFGTEIKKQIESDNSISNYYQEMLLNNVSNLEITQRMYLDTRVDINNIGDKGRSVVLDSTLSNAFEDFSLQRKYFRYPNYLWYLHRRLEPIFNNILIYRYENNIKTGEYEYIKMAVVKDRKLNDYQEFLMAIFIGQMLSDDEMDYNSELKLIHSFQKDYPQSKYLKELNSALAGFYPLKSGVPLKEIEMHDINGKAFSVSSLKGNLLYIDVWATWCGPCLDELEYSEKLSKKYAGHPDLKFVYVSIDEDKEKWKKFLKKNTRIKGLHGIQNAEVVADSNMIKRLYKFDGIPRYILIDKNGNIVTTNAKRPSELVSSNYLHSLLSL